MRKYNTSNFVYFVHLNISYMKSAAALLPYFLEEKEFMKRIKAKGKKATIKNRRGKRPCLA